jgi:hypothetical protein
VSQEVNDDVPDELAIRRGLADFPGPWPGAPSGTRNAADEGSAHPVTRFSGGVRDVARSSGRRHTEIAAIQLPHESKPARLSGTHPLTERSVYFYYSLSKNA